MKTFSAVKRIYTDYLAATGSVLIGMGSVMNLGGKYFLHNRAKTSQAADVIALRQDFAMIGQDISDLIATHPESDHIAGS